MNGVQREIRLNAISSALIRLALMVGVIQLSLGAFKLGTIVNFVSHPVILGFMNAAAVIIALSQFDMLLGIPKGRSDSFLVDIWEMFGYLPQAHLPTLAMSAFALALMLGLKKNSGATGDKKGLIAAASGGTLFLDDITEMSTSMQVKLLRVIQEREVLRLGCTEPLKVDVRFIAATNRDLQESMKSGNFRQDLYFRLNVVNLHIPTLSQRKDDIPLLAYFHLKKFAALMKKEVLEISAEAMSLLKLYDFPGNVRELENIIERGVALSSGNSIETMHLPDDLRELSMRTFRKKDGKISSLEEQEKDYIRWVLQEANGNQTVAAQMLGIDRVSLWRKLKRYELEMQ